MAKTNEIKRLNPKGADTKYLGSEPEWPTQPADENRVSALANGFHWYNYHYGKKDAKDMLCHYLEHNGRTKDARTMRGIPDSQIRLTPAWVCRMTLLGLMLKEHEQTNINEQLNDMLNSKQEAKRAQADVDADAAVARLTIQDHLREKISECSGELEGMFDDFIDAGAKMSADFKPLMLMRGMNISPNMIGTVARVWELRLAEFSEVLEGKDPQLVEGYSHLSKLQLRNCVKFCETVINDCNSYIQLKKVERKPRKAKPVSPEKKAAKFKICAEFTELKLKSLPASQLVDKSEAWVYDTKKRKLIHIVADEYAKVFTVKNNSVIGFSKIETVQKTLRKPAETVKLIGTAGKPAARKIFKELTTTETAWNARGTENLVILRAW
jgi:hypothetical protein